MAEKLAPPTPTMMTDIGRLEARISASLVSRMSERVPSVNSSRIKYCCWGTKRERRGERRKERREGGKERNREERREREEGGKDANVNSSYKAPVLHVYEMNWVWSWRLALYVVRIHTTKVDCLHSNTLMSWIP